MSHVLLHLIALRRPRQCKLRSDPRQFTLRELRDQAVFIYEDTHLLAEHYHWPEAEILALPRERRLRYAQMVRASRSAA